jgi:hypothetical protein
VAGVILIVEQGLAFEVWRRGQQDELAVHVIDEKIAAAVVKPYRPQRLDDHFSYFGRWPEGRLPGVDGFGNLVGAIHLLHDAFAQDSFGLAADKFDGGDGVEHFILQACIDLLGEGLLNAVEGRLRILPALPQIIADKPDR